MLKRAVPWPECCIAQGTALILHPTHQRVAKQCCSRARFLAATCSTVKPFLGRAHKTECNKASVWFSGSSCPVFLKHRTVRVVFSYVCLFYLLCCWERHKNSGGMSSPPSNSQDLCWWLCKAEGDVGSSCPQESRIRIFCVLIHEPVPFTMVPPWVAFSTLYLPEVPPEMVSQPRPPSGGVCMCPSHGVSIKRCFCSYK